MFTGIIEEVGRVAAIRPQGGGRRITFRCGFADELRADESVAVNGVCLTVVETGANTFDAVAVEETLSKTTLGDLSAGAAVNLERALRAGGRLDGHLVQGHVDATLEVSGIRPLETSWMIDVRYDPAFARYLIPVGSVTLDGISLTVARLDKATLTVAIIPYTFTHTTVSTWRPGTRVNVEFDVIGKYVARSLDLGAGMQGLSEQMLRDHGFGID